MDFYSVLVSSFTANLNVEIGTCLLLEDITNSNLGLLGPAVIAATAPTQ